MRRGLRAFLDLQDGIAVVGEAADGAEAVARATALRPDIVLMDLVMPGVDGIEATAGVKAACPDTKVLVLSSFADDEKVFHGIRRVAAGESVLAPRAARRVLEQFAGVTRRPEGTVTIVFTDVEGSTAILEALGDAVARELFREHDQLVREAVVEHGGFEVEHEGDSFMLAFSSARSAVLCAVAIQRAISGQAWELPVRVRVGLNTGEVIAEEKGYFGKAVFLAARIASCAGGGEIVASELTRALLADTALPWRDRGETSLKGLAATHRLFELAWEEVPA